MNQEITDFDNLFRAFRKSRSNRSYTYSSMQFELNAVSGLSELKQELESGRYQMSGYTELEVSVPKRRTIKACKFRDKIVQHAICDSILCPGLQKICITDNAAGQKKKGTGFARERLKKKLQNFAFANGTDGYIFKGDISKYYYNINHTQAKDIMEYHYPPEYHWLIDLFIDSTDGEKGIALGNQINTIVSNLYLDGFDKFVTGELGIRYYGRYADDFYLIHENKEYLKHCVECITEFLDTLELKLNPKSQIFPVKNGISFLGFHFYIRGNAVEIRLDNSKKRAYRRKFNRMYRKVQRGDMDPERLHKSYESWKIHASYCTDHGIFGYYDRKMKEVIK